MLIQMLAGLWRLAYRPERRPAPPSTPVPKELE
jgi:hypothetical protein